MESNVYGAEHLKTIKRRGNPEQISAHIAKYHKVVLDVDLAD